MATVTGTLTYTFADQQEVNGFLTVIENTAGASGISVDGLSVTLDISLTGV